MISNRFSAWLHRRLLRLYPAEFREEFGTEMEQDFRARMARRGRRAVAVWGAVLLDWLISMPREQLDVTRRDLRTSVRAFARAPLFTCVVVLSLAIGIAATAMVFTIANSLLIQTPLDEDPSRFVGVLRGDGTAEPSSWPDYLDYRDRNRSFSQMAAWTIAPVFLGRGGRSQSVMAETVSDNYFDMIAVRPFLGRLFRPGECPSTCAQQLILSHRFWRRAYDTDPGIVGRQVALGGVPATVVGVAPEGFDGTLAPVMTDIWIHVENRRITEPSLFSDRGTRWLAIAGRLKPGVSRAQAVADLNTIDRELQREHRYTGLQDRRLWASAARGVAIPTIRRQVEIVVTLLGAIAMLVLLVSCANVANMLLARATARRQETAIRRALGAGRSRVIRLSLTESLLLAGLGGVAGGLLSSWFTRLLPVLQPPANDLYTYRIAMRQDFRVWAFTFAISLFSGVLFGVLPALRAARVECLPAIRNQDVHGRPRSLAQKMLVSCQVVSSLVLLVAAGLFYRSFAGQQQLAPELSGVPALIVPLNLDLAAYAGDQERGRRFYATVKESVRSIAGVDSAALASDVPLNAVSPQVEVSRDVAAPIRAALDVIDPDYLATMNVQLLAGRNFTASDRGDSTPVALVDEQLARLLWAGDPRPLESATGRTVRVGEDRRPVRLVGVVASGVRRSLTQAPRPMLFLPVAQRYSSMLYLVVRTKAAPEELIEGVRRAVEAVDDSVSLRRIRTLESQRRDALWPIRTGARVVAAACAVAVVLALFGLYGVIAYSMARRQREIAIRIALGAGPGDVLALGLRQGLRVTLWGIAVGLPVSALANVALARVLYGLRPFDPAVFVVGLATWMAVSTVACVPPAWRAVRQSPDAIRDAG